MCSFWSKENNKNWMQVLLNLAVDIFNVQTKPLLCAGPGSVLA